MFDTNQEVGDASTYYQISQYLRYHYLPFFIAYHSSNSFISEAKNKNCSCFDPVYYYVANRLSWFLLATSALLAEALYAETAVVLVNLADSLICCRNGQ